MPRNAPRCTLLGVCSIVSFIAACGGTGSEREDASAPPAPAESPVKWEVSPDLQVAELRPGVWLHTSWRPLADGTRFPSNGLIVLDGDSLFLIDTAWGDDLTEELLGWIDGTLRLPIARVIATHFHDDRIGGAPAMERRGIPVLTHPLTRRLAAADGLPAPDTVAGLTVPGSAVRLGMAEVFYPGPGHTEENLMVWLPDAGILFGGCAVRPAGTTSLGNVADADTVSWPIAIERAEQRYGTAAIVVPSHGPPGGAELLPHTRSLFSR